MTDFVDAPSDVVEAPTIVLPDRADAPVSEVTERFLRAVIAQVPIDLIEEVHLFSPLRQGTVETGIAVLAARVPIPVVAVPEPSLDFSSAPDGVERSEDLSEQVITENTGDSVVDEVVADPAGDDEVTADEAVEMVHDESVLVDIASDDEDVAVIEAIGAAPVPMVRHTVYTARYRYVIKGPERGKWEANVKAEADAPLVTVETVVRGVQRRAGEESEIVRFTQAQLAKALRVSLG